MMDVALPRVNPDCATILSAVGFLAAPLAMVAPNALTLVAVIAAGFALAWGPRAELLNAIPRVPAALLGTLVAFGMLSATWSIVPAYSAIKVLQLLVLFSTALVLIAMAKLSAPQRRAAIGLWLAAGVTVAITVVLFESLTDGLLQRLVKADVMADEWVLLRYKRGAVVTAILLWPAVYCLFRRYGSIPAAALTLAAIFAFAELKTGTAYVALAAGAVAAGAMLLAPVATARIGAGLLALMIIFMPLINYTKVADIAQSSLIGDRGLGRIESSALHRLAIWQFARDRIAERPLTGWGLDSSRAVPGGKGKAEGHGELMPLHPHNAILQLWLELGLVAAVIAVLMSLKIIPGIPAAVPDPKARAVFFGSLVSAIVIALAGFGLWQSWWIASLMLGSALLVAILSPAAPSR